MRATVESTVTQVIEQQLTGIDRMLYFTSSSASDGSITDHSDLRHRHRIPTSRRCRRRTA